jgi:DNA-binding winged helix-turn-helix (wHTH) protein
MGIHDCSSQAIRFGPFEADLLTRELRKNGVKIKLQEQPFAVLAALLGQPGRVFSRDDLQARIWPRGVVVDFERGINKAINRLREALGDSAEQPRFIETLPKRGYRFTEQCSSASSRLRCSRSTASRPRTARTTGQTALWTA